MLGVPLPEAAPDIVAPRVSGTRRFAVVGRLLVVDALVVCALAVGAVACSATPDPPGTPGPSVSDTSADARSAQPAPSSTASAPATVDPVAKAAEAVRGLSDADLVGQVLMPSVNLTDSAADAASLVTRFRLGGVILMGNIENTTASATASQVRSLTDQLRAAAKVAPGGADVDLIVGTDQEYGWVTRIRSGVVQLPSAMAFGAAARPDLTEAAWRGAGAELAAVGIDINFAPTADVLGSPANYTIGSRSYGSQPAAVAAQVAAAVRGLQASGVAAAIKHFPGHGHTTTNSHEALPVLGQSRSSLTASDLPPFRAGIDAGTWLVMSGHLDVRAIDPGVPASFSRKVLVDLLRGQLGFRGVVITDALNMKPAMAWPAGEAAVRALLAGNDLLLMPPDLAAAHQGLLDAVKSGRLPRARLVEAATRVLTLKFRIAAIPRPALSTVNLSTVESTAHRDAAQAVAAASVTLLRGACTGALVGGGVRVTASGGRGQQVAWLAAALKSHGVPVVAAGGQRVHLVGYGDGVADLAADARVTVGMDTPYVLGSATSPVRIATYSSSQVAMQALAAVLAGKAKAPGRSPVAVAGLPRSACAG